MIFTEEVFGKKALKCRHLGFGMWEPIPCTTPYDSGVAGHIDHMQRSGLDVPCTFPSERRQAGKELGVRAGGHGRVGGWAGRWVVVLACGWVDGRTGGRLASLPVASG